jgi:hypothetical protein
VVDRGLDRQRLRLKLRELKSVVLELDRWAAERFSVLGVADRLQHRALGHAGAPYSSKYVLEAKTVQSHAYRTFHVYVPIQPQQSR